jgi:hypothetical protein
MKLQGLPATAAVLNGKPSHSRGKAKVILSQFGQKITFLTFTSHKEKKKCEVVFIYKNSTQHGSYTVLLKHSREGM